MSEYQYYEFQAIDRPLTDRQMRYLRSYSTRAQITCTSFINEYHWGDFKGDQDAWMAKYFDAFLYIANWGTRVLKLRLPSRLLDIEIVQTYCSGENAWICQKGDNSIVSFVSEDEEGDSWVETEGRLSSLIPIRAELMRGDLRALYLGWLLCAQEGELDDSDTEPAVPPGLGQLSGSLSSLVEFLRIDEDLLDIAAQSSPAMENVQLSGEQIQAWLASLPTREKDTILAHLIVSEDRTPVIELLHRFLEHQKGECPLPRSSVAGRTVGQLLDAGEAHAKERQRIEAEQRAKERERRERIAAMARAQYLDTIAGRQGQLWTQIDGLIAETKPKSYVQAIDLLIDLRDLAERERKGHEFQARIDAITATHARKSAFMERLQKAGLR